MQFYGLRFHNDYNSYIEMWEETLANILSFPYEIIVCVSYVYIVYWALCK